MADPDSALLRTAAPPPPRSRWIVWKEAFWHPWVGQIWGVYTLAALLDRITGWTGLQTRFGVVAISSRLSRQNWFIAALFLTIYVLLQSLYRVVVERDVARRQLRTEKRNQELSDLMSDHHEYAVHELLNKTPANFLELHDIWEPREREWRKRVMKDMERFECSKQERRHVDTLGLVTPILQHEDPSVMHALNMLVTRMARIADIAGKYGE